jgi:anion-transporting  ArsA/GET3 family ATPase
MSGQAKQEAIGLAALVEGRRILVCCGAGGVGKTTTSAALALGAARAGRRVLVLTIDPSRRLAETLGASTNTPHPVALDARRATEAGLDGKGSLDVWVLDPKQVSDATVRRLARSPAEAERLLDNSIYKQVTRLIAGMQEYTAMEALDGFVDRGRYDLVVLDTPPSRNALNFLEAPGRLGEFLDGRIFKVMVPQGDSGLVGTSRRMVNRVLEAVFGQQFFNDLQVFFGAFAIIFAQLNGNAQKMRRRLQLPDVGFVLVTSPARQAVDDALFFEEKIQALELPLGAFVLNRSRAALSAGPPPTQDLLPPDASDLQRSALRRLQALAERERSHIHEHKRVLAELQDRTQERVPAIAVPELGRAIEDMAGLAELAGHLLNPGRSGT